MKGLIYFGGGGERGKELFLASPLRWKNGKGKNLRKEGSSAEFLNYEKGEYV